MLKASASFSCLPEKQKKIKYTIYFRVVIMWFIYTSNEKGSNFSQIWQNSNMEFP